MRSHYARFFGFLIILGDLLLLNGCFLLAGALRFDDLRIQDTEYYDYYVQLAVFFNFSWVLLSLIFKTYDIRKTLEPRKSTGKVLNVFFIHAFILLVLLVGLKKGEYSRQFLFYFYSFFLVTVLPWRFYFLRLLRAFRRKGLGFRNAIIVGRGPVLERFYRSVNEHPEYGLRVVGYFSDDPVAGIPLSGEEQAVAGFLKNHAVDEIYCAFPSGYSELGKWFRLADENLVRFRVIPDLGLKHATAVEIDFYHDVPVLIHRKEPLELLQNRLLKRLFDIVFSVLVLLLVFPWLFPILAIGVRLSGKGPILFNQERTGIREDAFTIYKFRSMVVNDESDTRQAAKGDVRITRFGRFMRKHNLDELPQFFNVLRGEMSVVGPRPHMLAHTAEYRKLIDRFMVRHFAKPGITGLSQVRGLRGEIRSQKDMKDRAKTDVYYIENWSVLLDIKIILLTILNTFKGKEID